MRIEVGCCRAAAVGRTVRRREEAGIWDTVGAGLSVLEMDAEGGGTEVER